MKILIDARMLGWTGIGRYTGELLHQLAVLDSEHSISLLIRDDPEEGHFPGDFHLIRTAINPYTVQEQLMLGGLLNRQHADLVHFVHFNVPLTFRGRYVVTVHDLTLMANSTQRKNTVSATALNHLRRFASAAIMRGAVRRAEHVITPSEATAAILRANFGCDRELITVTYEAAGNLAALPEAIPLLRGLRPLILYVGNSYPFKNLAVIPAAMSLMDHAVPDVRLVLAGEGDVFRDRMLQSLAPGLRERVIDLGRVSEGQLAWLYENCSVFVFPSFSEGFGLTGLEALAHGLPVIASNRSALPEVYGDAALYFDPTDAQDLANKLISVLQSSRLREELQARGVQRASDFSWRRMAEQTLDCYNAVLAQ